MRLVWSVLMFGAFAGIATADGLPPPPPKGLKYVSVNSEVVLGKDVAGYVFVQEVSQGRGVPQFTYSKLELSEKKATALPAGGRRSYVRLFAVSQDTATEFKTDAELFDAIKANKVKGVRIVFANMATVSDKVKGDPVKWTYTITAIDAKGIKTKVEGEGYEEPKPKDGDKKDAPEDDSDAPVASAHAPRGGVWIAGTAASLAVMLGGLWLAGRTRRKA